jgi:peptidyl-prolyl cis-trans isomerase SurA
MEQDTQTPKSPSSRGGIGFIAGTIALIVLIGGGAYAYFVNPDIFSSLDGSDAQDSAVVATVDGEAVTQADIDLRIARNAVALSSQGIDVNNPDNRTALETQTLNQLINEFLIVRDALVRGISIAPAEIDEQYAAIQARFDSETLFESELERNSFTEAALRESIEHELLIQKYVDQVVDPSALVATNEEIQAVYDSLEPQEGGEIPPLEEIRQDIENRIVNQKIQQALSDVIGDLRSDADIVVSGETAQTEPSEGAGASGESE